MRILKTASEDKPLGYHMMLDCAGCLPESIRDQAVISEFLTKLVDAIGMTKLDEPIFKYGAEGEPWEGWSVIQFIETSAITCHFLNPDNKAFIDVFSCKEFEPEIVAEHVKATFSPSKCHVAFRHRDA